ncbi:hypothetical protein HGRIS_013032 [Hohenbuehelia grisea]|uniref:Phorbol-ester/DAG-type domain-containing protein n=1 Tax=Hohenbuehelia grisea TaxID=104357 RepID=A0ABR3IU68_9AGAR
MAPKPLTSPGPPRLSVDLRSPGEDITFDVPSPTSPAAYKLQTWSFTSDNVEDPPSPTVSTHETHSERQAQKNFDQLLTLLENRHIRVTVFDTFNSSEHEDGTRDKGITAVAGAVRGFVASNVTNPVNDDDDDTSEEDKILDGIVGTLIKIQKQYMSAKASRYNLFAGSTSTRPGLLRNRHSSGKSPSPFRRSRSRHSFQFLGERSRSSSPTNERNHRIPERLSRCIALLESLITEDCRVQTAGYRPLLPQNGLQAVVLTFAQLLLDSFWHHPDIVFQISMTVIPSFEIFAKSMHMHLLTFFDEAIIRQVLQRLADRRNAHESGASAHKDADMSGHAMVPAVAIHVDTAHDDTAEHSGWKPWTSQVDEPFGLPSTEAPFQDPAIYFLSGLVSPLLAAVLDAVDIFTKPSQLEIYHFYRLIDGILSMKSDAYQDLLDVISYHTPAARYSAISLLLTFWPNALGHISVSKPFPITSYQRAMNLVERHYTDDDCYAHQFTPWSFTSSHAGMPVMSQNDCRACASPINGFGLKCPFCMCAVHFGCYDYPEGCRTMEYSSTSNNGVQRIAMFRFSDVLSTRRDTKPHFFRPQQHHFRLTNTFTLCLCFLCQNPLWGSTSQGLRCAGCSMFAHPACLQQASLTDIPLCREGHIPESRFTIEWSKLKRSCQEHYGDILSTPREEFARRSFEEMSVLHALFWTQTQILRNGLETGSIVLLQKGRDITGNWDPASHEFEIHHAARLAEELIKSGTLGVSPMVEDYLRENNLVASESTMMFDWPMLTYLISSIKSYQDSDQQRDMLTSSPSFLTAVSHTAETHPAPQPFELMQLSHMRDILATGFRLYSDYAAKHLLLHMHHLGLFQTREPITELFGGTTNPQHIHCVFPLPLGSDLSITVETLVSSVEACLLDIDLSVNEFGFLLLTRRLWPNGMATDYLLRRLTRSVLSWIIAEDEKLIIVLRDYLPKKARLPGVRTPNDPVPWPFVQNSRPTPASSVNNGGDYIALRRTLQTRYVVPWLLALHNLDPALYTNFLYEIAIGMAEEQMDEGSLGLDGADRDADHLDKILAFVTRFSQNFVAFSIFDDLFLRWAQALSVSKGYQKPMPSLSRLLHREPDSSNRMSLVHSSAQDSFVTQAGDAWLVVTNMASQSSAGFSQSMRWLVAFAHSGLDIPMSTWIEFSSLVDRFNASFNDCELFVEAAVTSIWLRSMGRQQIQGIIGSLQKRLSSFIVDSLKSGTNTERMLTFLRRSFATCLLVCGCNRDNIKSLGLVLPEEVDNLPSRRKLAGRAEANSDPVVMDMAILQAIEVYIACGVDSVTSTLAKFLYLFLSESPFFESYEIDNFILRNSTLLCTCVWRFYELQLPEISDLRANLLSRTLVVDQQPLRSVLQASLNVESSWETRLNTVNRLFRILLDLLNPAFVIEDRQWQSCVDDVIYYFFTSAWLDEKEEIRLAVDIMSKSLLPGHFHAITRCWNQYMTTMPIADRAQLVSFLVQLHAHFPQWHMLSWQVIMENFTNLESTGVDEEPRARSRTKGDNNTMIEDKMRVSLLVLSLQLIASGLCTSHSTLLKVKFYLVRALGFLDVSVATAVDGSISRIDFIAVEEMKESVYPCIKELCSVLDASHSLPEPLPTQVFTVEQRNAPALLVGSAFADVAIALIVSIKDFNVIPVLTLKSTIEALAIIIYKHDLLDKRLEHLQLPLRKAMQPILELLHADGSYEVRQMALSVVQMFVRNCPAFTRHFIGQSIESVAKLISLQSHYGQHDLLIGQAKTFIESTLSTYSDRLFYTICRHPLDAEFFTVMKLVTDPHAKGKSIQAGPLREVLLRDTLNKAAEGERESFQNVMNNLWSFVDVVYHQGYNLPLVLFVGQHLTFLGRRACEWPADALDTSPLLLMAAKIMQFNKVYCRELLPYVDIMLRTVLTRLTVNTKSLVQLVHVSSSLFRKTQPELPGQASPNNVVQIIFEILGDGLRLKTRVHPASITAMLETLTSEDHSGKALSNTYLSSFLGLVDNGFYFLLNYTWSSDRIDADFNASVAVARMILEATTRDQNIMIRLSEHAMEKPSRQGLGVRGWNIMAFAALSDQSGVWAKTVLDQVQTFSIVHHAALRSVVLSNGPLDAARTDINYAYIAIKLWILLTKMVSKKEDVDWTTWLRVWNQLWFPFQSLLNLLEDEVTAESTLATVTWSSVAELIYFIYSLRCPLVMRTIDLEGPLQRSRDAGRVPPSHKINKALRCHTEQPPEASMELVLTQMSKDLVAEEKLRAALERDTARERRGAPEKHRKDTWMPI